MAMVTSSVLFVPGQDRLSRERPLGALSPRSAACQGLIRLIVALTCAVLAVQPATAAENPSSDEHPQCASHLWAAGAQLGRAEAVARQDSPAENAGMLDAMREAGRHVEKANALCAQQPAPWPAWPNWRATQEQITSMVDKFQTGEMDRRQLAIGLVALHQSLASRLAAPQALSTPTNPEVDATCVEIYMRLGETLSFAQTTTRISGHLTPDAVRRLRHALSLIYQMREMQQPCLDFMGLIPAINAALKSSGDPSVVGQVDDIVRAGEFVTAPRTE
jgi:hypothetical protein